MDADKLFKMIGEAYAVLSDPDKVMCKNLSFLKLKFICHPKSLIRYHRQLSMEGGGVGLILESLKFDTMQIC